MTPARLAQFSRSPAFRPATPPVQSWPLTEPETVHPMICPWASLCPAMPPTALSPRTVPEKAQFCSVPAFRPAMPPTVERVPSGATVPFTVRFRTAAPGWT